MNARLISRNLHTNTRIWPRRYRQTRLNLTRIHAQNGGGGDRQPLRLAQL
jgi:hypothetical protein